jgi:hypothetical protein
VLHYRAFLNDLAAKSNSKTIAVFADERFENKASSSNRKLKARTLAAIRKHSEGLKQKFGKIAVAGIHGANSAGLTKGPVTQSAA